MPYDRKQLTVLHAGLGYYKPHAVIIGGAAMVFHGLLTTTNDLDVALPKEIMNHHAGEPSPVEDASFIPARYWSSGREGIDFCSGGATYVTNPAEIVEIDGVRVLAKPALLRFYQQLNRPKDQEKIAILEQTLRCLANVREALFSKGDPMEQSVLVTMTAPNGVFMSCLASPQEAYEFYDRNAGRVSSTTAE